jgi:hypothetical protein
VFLARLNINNDRNELRDSRMSAAAAGGSR